MDLHLIGTGTCTPVKGRGPACYYLTSGASRIIIDPGPGAANRIADRDLDPMDVDAIFLSHHHLDHSAGLAPWLFSYKYCLGSAAGGGKRRDPLIVAPEGFKKVFDGILNVYGDMLLSDEYDVKIEEVSQTQWKWPGGLEFVTAPMSHSTSTVGYLFRRPGGPALAYSGDTELCPGLVELASQADALLVECSLPDDKKMEGHMTPSQVAQAGMESGVKKLILTHFYPLMAPEDAVAVIRKAGYEGQIICGEDGMVVSL